MKRKAMSTPAAPPESAPSPVLEVERRLVMRWLWGLGGLLTLASLGSQILKYQAGIDWGMGLLPKFFFDAEDGFGTFYATTLLLTCGLLLWWIAASVAANAGAFAKHWRGLSIIFILMAMDEAVGLHELLIPILRDGLGTSGLLHYAWVIVGAAVVLIVGLVYLRFVLVLPGPIRTRFILAAVLYVGGALGVELFEGGHVSEHGIENLTYGIFVTVEEALELAGLSVFILALLRCLEAGPGRVILSFARSEADREGGAA